MKPYQWGERFPLFRMTIAAGNWTCFWGCMHCARPQSVKIYTTLFSIFNPYVNVKDTERTIELFSIKMREMCRKVGFPRSRIHSKKRFAVFPPPAGMSLTKLSLAGIYFNYYRPGRVWSVTYRLGTGNLLTFFLQCITLTPCRWERRMVWALRAYIL